MNRYLLGALAGCAATAPMTALMELLHHLPVPEPKTLPPRTITENVARAANLGAAVDTPYQSTIATIIAHFAFGAGAGALYAPLEQQLPQVPAPLKGAGFGVIVWAVSYLGWLPATGLLRPATEQSARRNFLMIVAHLLWGACLGALCERGDKREA